MWADVAFYKIFSTVSVLFMTLDGPQGAEGDASANVDHHLEQGKRLLAAGQLTEALSHYHSAIEGDPSNYMSYFKRATVLLALGRSKSALPDLTNTIELRPDFLKARTQRGNIYLKQGKLEDAKEDYTIVVDKEPSNQEAITKLTSINPLKEEIEAGRAFFENGDYEAAVQSLTNPVEQCPWNIELRELRAKGNEFIGEYFKAIQDLRVTTKLFSDNTEGYLKMSQLYYQLGEGDDSLKEIRECLKLDQDHKRCHTHYKKVKKLVKFFTDAQNYMDRNNYVDAIFKLNAALKMESRNRKFLVKAKEKLCTSHLKMSEANEAIKVCTETIEIESQNVNAYCDRAEAYLLLEDKLEEALVDFQKAKEINNDLRRAKEGIIRVNKLIKQSKKRDYYKILGVSRTASKSEITKKFRKLAAKWHPDKHKGEDREKAEKKFIDLAHAKEVLSDPEKRAKYDQGEDPLDPEAQQQQGPSHGFNGFQEGFGEGFNFKFHFN